MLLGTSNGDIEQAALLFQLTHRTHTHRRREDILFQSDDEDGRKLQALCGMNGHQRHLRLVLVTLAVEVGEQRHLLQEVIQVRLSFPILFLATFHKVLHTT